MSNARPCSLIHKLDACRQGFTQKEEKRKLAMVAEQSTEPEIHCRKRFKINCDDSVSVSSASTSQPTSQSDELSFVEGSVPSSVTSSSLEWVYTNKPVYKYQSGVIDRNLLFSSSILIFWGWTKTCQHQEIGDPFGRLAKSARTLIQECSIEQGAHTFLAADWQVFDQVLSLLKSLLCNTSPSIVARRKPRTCIHVCRLGCGLGILKKAWAAWLEKRSHLPGFADGDATENSVQNGPSRQGWPLLGSLSQHELARCKPLLHSLGFPVNNLPSAPHFVVTPLWLRACQRDNWRYELPHFEFFTPSPKDCSPGLFRSRTCGSLRLLLLGFEYGKRMPPRDATSFTFWRTAVNCALGGKAWEESDLQEVARVDEVLTSEEQYRAYDEIVSSNARSLVFRPFASRHNAHGDFTVHNHSGYPDIVILYHGSRNVEDYVKNGRVPEAASRAAQMLLMHRAGIPMFTFTWLVDCYRMGTLCRKADYLLNEELRLDELLKRTCDALSEVISRDHNRRRDATQDCVPADADDNHQDSWWMRQEFRMILEQHSNASGASLLSQALTAGTNMVTQPLSLTSKPLMPKTAVASSEVGVAFTHSTFSSYPGLPAACLATFALADTPVVIGPLTFALEHIARTTTLQVLSALQVDRDTIVASTDKLMVDIWDRVVDFISTYLCGEVRTSDTKYQASQPSPRSLVAHLFTIGQKSQVRAAAFHLASLLPLTLRFGDQFRERTWAPSHPSKCFAPNVDLTYIVQGDEYSSLACNIQAMCHLASFMIAYDFNQVVRSSVVKQSGFTPALLIGFFLDELVSLIGNLLQETFKSGDSFEQYLELIIPIRTLVETASATSILSWPKGLAAKRQARLEELKSFATDFNEIGQILYHRREYSLTPVAIESLNQLISSIGRCVCQELHAHLSELDTMSPWKWKREGALSVLHELQKFPDADAPEEAGGGNKYYAQLGYYDREDPMFFSSQAALPPLEFEIDFGDRKSFRSKAEDAIRTLQSEFQAQLNVVACSYNTLKHECLTSSSDLELESLRDQVLSLILPN